MIKKLLIIISLLWMSLMVSASEEAISLNNQEIATKPDKLVELKEKAELYKLLFENAKESNDRLVSSIHVIIGTVITFFLALFGAQLFFNFKLKKEEIEKIKSDVNEQFSNLYNDVTNKTGVLFKNNEKEMSKSFSLYKKEINETIKEKLSEESKLISSKLEKHEEQIKNVQVNSERLINQLKIQLERTVGDVWDLRGVESNALGRYVRTALLALENGNDVTHIINDIVKLLNNQVDLHEVIKTELEELSQKLPGSFESQKEFINTKISSLEIYKFVDDPLNPGQSIIKVIES